MTETVEIARGPYRAQLLALGATLRRLEVPDREGRVANVVLGCRDLDDYRRVARYYGATVGRYANRIGGARFMLDGREYRLPANDGPNNLHSGAPGFDQRDWALEDADASSARFGLTSPDGENGFPGTLRVEALYRMEEDGLAITLSAQTDAPTVLNLTNHAYFNLGGEASGRTILDHVLRIAGSHITPVDADLIPTGALRPVANSPFDFRTPKPVGRDIAQDDTQLVRGLGYDHNWAIDAPGRAATLYDPESGRVLDLHSTKPGLQLYSGNHLADGPPGTSGGTYAARAGLCLEPQLFPDSPNRPEFPSARLDPGERYEHRLAFRFRTAGSVDEAFG
ncbi:galactose mutarotase [Sphingomonas sp. AOB5]|uniref:aldose epimerase family protein n=1 Tax=Sphingomonas sp. AOB5 TaxID=3034017 RepID=UPI0023F62DEF|nr:aldose epimerase family protein [Sphingomonas sp. AOB5]MDF7775286.1 galactose mutarotase [Sphingomonas sp. AOB5]